MSVLFAESDPLLDTQGALMSDYAPRRDTVRTRDHQVPTSWSGYSVLITTTLTARTPACTPGSHTGPRGRSEGASTMHCR